MTQGIVVEHRRKLFHLFSAAYAVLYAWAGREPFLWVLGLAVLAGAGVEAARLRHPVLNQRLLDFFGGVHREKEINRPSGIFWTIVGCFLTALLIPDRDIVIAAMLYLALGDGLAGWVGRTWGRIRIGGKSVEGSLACFLGCWAVGAVVLTPAVGRPEALVGALLAATVEFVSPPPDDNMTLPLISGAALYFVRSGL